MGAEYPLAALTWRAASGRMSLSRVLRLFRARARRQHCAGATKWETKDRAADAIVES